MGLGGVAIATLPSVIFPKLMFSDRLGGVSCLIGIVSELFLANLTYVAFTLFHGVIISTEKVKPT